MEPGAIWWFVSDLHLDPDGADPRGTDGALAEFVDAVVLDSGAPERHLVLLGDTFELSKAHVGSGNIGLRICETVAGFPTVFVSGQPYGAGDCWIAPLSGKRCRGALRLR